jgi:hypothetical protein
MQVLIEGATNVREFKVAAQPTIIAGAREHLESSEQHTWRRFWSSKIFHLRSQGSGNLSGSSHMERTSSTACEEGWCSKL